MGEAPRRPSLVADPNWGIALCRLGRKRAASAGVCCLGGWVGPCAINCTATLGRGWVLSGGAGSGESEIRRFVLENDLLEAIIGLPTDMFYNTGISTYVWIVTNRKPPHRKGKVQLIDASSFWRKMRKSLGSKRKEMSVASPSVIAPGLNDAARAGTFGELFERPADRARGNAGRRCCDMDHN
jgi:N-6 DNA Methylase